MMNQSVLFGTIISADENKILTVSLENGDRGVVTLSEASRRVFPEGYPADQLIGRRLGFMAGERNADGMIELSARRYEEWCLDEIRAALENRTRNVYPAELVSVTPNLAYYRIAQGVNGGVTLGDFAFAYTSSFDVPSIRLPRYATVVVKQVLDSGRVDLSMRPAFGDFEQNIDRLGIDAGVEFTAPVTGKAKNGSAGVAMLSPNLTVLCGSIPVGETVRLRCTELDREAHRMRVEVLDRTAGSAPFIDYEKYLFPADMLGDYVDLEAFDARLRPAPSAAKAALKPVEVDFDIPANTHSSPFAISEGETIIHDRRPSNHYALVREIESGILDERHRQVARAVCDLRYSNLFLIQHYLCAKHGIKLAAATMKAILSRLTAHNILSTMTFRRENGSKSTPVYVCGAQYRSFMGEYARLQAWEYTNQDASIPKTRLCSNQLLIGLMNSGNVTEHDPHPYILLNAESGSEIRVRPRHRIVMDGRICYLEGVRSNWDFASFAEKLNRYQRAFDFTGESAEILVAVETREAAIELAQRVENELALNFPVRFCADLDALPTPDFVTAHPTRAGKAEASFVARMTEAAEKVIETAEKTAETPKGLLSRLKMRLMGIAA